MATTNSPASLGIKKVFRESPMPVNIIFPEDAVMPVVATVEMWYNGALQEDVTIPVDITDEVISFELSVIQLRAAAMQKKPYIYVLFGGEYKMGNLLNISMDVDIYNSADVYVNVSGIGDIRVNFDADFESIKAQADRAEGYMNTTEGYMNAAQGYATAAANANTGQFIHKTTMAGMRALSAPEKAGMIAGTYAGVMLHGYYAYGDTPGAIVYYKSLTGLADDAGSIIVIDGSLKLEHKFLTCDVSYYGLQDSTYYDAQDKAGKVATANRNTLMINNAIKIAPKIVISKPGKYWCRGNRGGESGAYYRHLDPLDGPTYDTPVWWQVGDGNGNPGGINLLSDRTFEMGAGVTLKMRGTFMDSYNFITIWNKENVIIRGGTIIGDFDLDPDLNEHIRLDAEGNKLVDGVTCDYIPGGLPSCNDGGQWGYGISLQGTKNVLLENIDISKMWADGINVFADYLNDMFVNTDLTLRNVRSHHNKRQGMSICGANRISAYNCEFAYTKGQDPESGVDIERDTTHEEVQVKDVNFIGCKFIGNRFGAVTTWRVEDWLEVKFIDCLYAENEVMDYYSNTSKGVEFDNCRFANVEDRLLSIKLNGVRNHHFHNCQLGGRVEVGLRDLGTIYKSKNVTFDNCKALDIVFPDTRTNFFDFMDSVNVKVINCDFGSIALQGDRILIVADGAENLDLLDNSFRELGEVWSIQNVNGFRFNKNSVINTLLSTGRLNSNVDRFELCDNTISGNSYYVASAGKPAFQLLGSGCSRGRISGNTIHSDVIFERVGSLTGTGLGLYREYANISDKVVILGNKTYGYTNSEAFQLNVSSTDMTVSYL